MQAVIKRTLFQAWALLGVCALLGAVATGASAAVPTITTPAGGTHFKSHKTDEIAPVAIEGTELHEVEAPNLPGGLHLRQATAGSETNWEIFGTPEHNETEVDVVITAKNATAESTSVEVVWTVGEPLPEITTVPGPQTSTVETTIAPLIVKATTTQTLEARKLPKGLHLEPVSGSEGEWQITGMPEEVTSATVVLKAKSTEGEETEASFKWTVVEQAPSLTAPLDQTSTAGKAIVPVPVEGTNLDTVRASAAHPLPAGLALTDTSGKWTITGTPTTTGSSTVELEAENAEGKAAAPASFKWTVNAPEVPTAKPPTTKTEVPSTPPKTTPSTPAVTSAGRLGTMPTQKQGRQLVASFLCEVQSCTVTIKAVIKVAKQKLTLRSSATKIAQGKKVKIPVKLSKKQLALIAQALKRHKKVTAALSATIHSSIGYQVTRALTVTVKR
jgi:hypothetical protein